METEREKLKIEFKFKENVDKEYEDSLWSELLDILKLYEDSRE